MYDSLHRADKNGKFSLRVITLVIAYDLTGKIKRSRTSLYCATHIQQELVLLLLLLWNKKGGISFRLNKYRVPLLNINVFRRKNNRSINYRIISLRFCVFQMTT